MPILDLKAHEKTVCFRYDQKELRECGNDLARCDAFCVQDTSVWFVEKKGNIDLKQAKHAINQINESFRRTKIPHNQWIVKKLILGDMFSTEAVQLMRGETIEHSELGHINPKYKDIKTIIEAFDV